MAKVATRVAYGDALKELMVENKNVVVLDADLAGSTKSGEAKKVDPSRHFDMGIAEGNMMSVAAGLAASGKIAYASTFAMFATGRGFEQIRNSIGYPQLNVKICASHAGISVGEDGASHQCIEDVSLMRGIPGMKVIVPCDYNEAKQACKAVAEIDGPCYVRLGRSGVESVNGDDYKFELGKGVVLQKGEKVLPEGRPVFRVQTVQKRAQIDAAVLPHCNVDTLDEITVDLHRFVGSTPPDVQRAETGGHAVDHAAQVLALFAQRGRLLERGRRLFPAGFFRQFFPGFPFLI